MTRPTLAELHTEDMEEWLAEHDAQIKAQALREAADRWETAVRGNTNWLDLEVADRAVGWLRDRAARIEAGDQP